jgi:GDSL-like Lipase/Acylhydrolase family
VLFALYPELWQVDWKGEEIPGEHPVRVLLLGGSVLHPAWGHVEQELRERLTVRLGRPVVTFNMAAIGHTSRDSLVKYRALAGTRFDLVVFYHGINDARANNVPPDRFRADYSHYAWYAAGNALEACRPWLVLPCTLRFLAVRASDRLGLVDWVPTDAPRPDWVAYGADPKSAEAFAANLRGVLAMAGARHEPVLAMTFATWVPDDYSAAAFRARTLDYTLHLSPLEMWGAPANVLAAVARHNEVVRTVAAESGAPLVDQATAMPKGGRYFNDACHLTGAGSTAFVDGMLDPVVAMLAGGARRRIVPSIPDRP